MNATPSVSETVEGDQVEQRRAKLAALRARGNAYPNDFRRSHETSDILSRYHDGTDPEPGETKEISLAGRMMSQRLMGKAAFCHIQDNSGRIQCYVRRDELPDGVFAEFKTWDLGDVLGVSGRAFRTKTGELSIRVSAIRLLVKAVRPLPAKYHGLQDTELRYRQRYLDLIMNPDVRDAFNQRSRLIYLLRERLHASGFTEMETPMMQALAGGAAARPFLTHHNALDMPLYLRIAPELYLKRLVVGGMEKVFEINRNFRNEGVSTRHNPEFTMLELYQAYADYHELMDLAESLMRYLAMQLLGKTAFAYQDIELDFSTPFTRMTLREAVRHYNPDLHVADLDNLPAMRAYAERIGVTLKPEYGLGKLQLEVFEKTVEHRLQQATFITAYPTEVSPLARPNDKDPTVTDRFELFVAGRELANGFSELNDPDDQADRFRQQLKDRELGDDEAMPYDDDYICALEHGLPPTAGIGIGIDRLVMLYTNAASIRDVLLFPLMRPQH